MKKILALAIVLTIVFSLTSCTVKLPDDWRLGGEISEVAKVDVYLVDSVEGSVLDIRDTDTLIYTIEGAKANEFITELLAADYGNKVYFPAPIDYAHVFKPGYIVFIEYSDGNCDVYAEQGVYIHRHNEDDGRVTHSYSHHSYMGDTPWNQFIEKYIHG